MTSPKRRNAVAKELRTPKYRQRVVRSRKAYRRRDKYGVNYD